ncbi:DnaJ domain-containing protein [Emcibacter sp. SYSU 3D8]|uniref:DnaJ domain-containing protein n=1 Tax=Emcibacter sp. SYSU 3D8 TaxID=3133969 RepID=UPI0031FEF429
MPLIFFGAIVLVLLVLLVNWAARADRATVRRVARYFGAFLVGVAALFLIARGLTGVALALLALAGTLASRKRLAFLGGGKKAPQQQSQVETSFLRVTLDHDTGDLAGVILAGRFAGQRLDELGREDFSTLYDELLRDDPEGARLLDAYLARAYPGEWRQEPGPGPAGDGPMTRDEAFEILGIAPDATATEIRDAHHRLMKKFHPDQGGSTYFATRLNEARDLLLKT